jgi:endonuclease YncB( thermonuclease family)
MRALRLDPNLVAYCGMTVLAMAWVVEKSGPAPEIVGDCRPGYVYDGDSVELICAGQRRTARLVGIDTPELGGARCEAERVAAEAAKRALAALVGGASVIKVVPRGTDKYGRDLITLRLNGRDAAEAMIAAGHGRAYDGGHRADWCG